jgi:hypothetical protein
MTRKSTRTATTQAAASLKAQTPKRAKPAFVLEAEAKLAAMYARKREERDYPAIVLRQHGLA